ncbi:hypothetical protein Ahy_A10g048493 [Arachis hypogaea]|uniref:FAR1 domain-containing protein n=1 Tax=Arachis hypogaea TaxID=3818 RepID=A0A445B599_ARAHY|nr:hypothetical protein Ahy_A10g048493 [Arachis hypogaea]
MIDADKAQTDSLHFYGVITCHIMGMNIDDNKFLEVSIKCAELCFGYNSSSDKEEDDIINNEGKVSESMEMVCNKKGKHRKKYLERDNRKKDHKPITRVMCRANIRFHYDLILQKWQVAKFEETHNHDLIPPKYIQFVLAYRTMTDAGKAQTDSLYFYGVITCHIMGFMVA